MSADFYDVQRRMTRWIRETYVPEGERLEFWWCDYHHDDSGDVVLNVETRAEGAPRGYKARDKEDVQYRLDHKDPAASGIDFRLLADFLSVLEACDHEDDYPCGPEGDD